MAIGRKVSPARFIGAALGVVGGVMNMFGGDGGAGAAQKKAQMEMNRQKKAFGALDTSNLAAGVTNAYSGIQTNFENTMEDLTVNQQQAQFEAEQGAQNRANIMQGMQGAAGGSGIASLAQAMANQGQNAARQASASIGQQESKNQMLAAQGAGQKQTAEAAAQMQVASGAQQAESTRLAGAGAARGLEYQKQEGIMGLAAGELSASNSAVAAAEAKKAGGLGQIIGGVASGVMGAATGGLLGKGQDGQSGVMGFAKKSLT